MRKLAILTAVALGTIVLASACAGEEETNVKPTPTSTAAVTPTTTLTPASGNGIRPVAGGFQGNDLDQGGTFKIILIVFKNESDVVDFVQLACAPKGVIAGMPSTVATDIKISGGRFKAESGDVAVEGQFVSPTKAEGTIRGLSDDAGKCGVPGEGQWSAECNLSVERWGEGFKAEPAASGPCAQP